MKIKNDSNQYLRLLSIHVSAKDDEIIQKLREMINHEKLLRHFTIKRLVDHIYLDWQYLY